ncbi:MAG: PIG-L family deacetylase [Verrucomicrobiota bacterium]|nr:PIG-L family deacetylase [Verrucomicrobiota bacterium]MEC8333152.1 PIG-L family deacetylase [Verrucomicrobiota bacterium]
MSQESSSSADLYISGQLSVAEAQARTSHLGIGAHQDDLEFMAYHGIATCYEQDSAWFSGITCTDGRGSARTGTFADKSDEEIAAIRVQEQRRAAEIGQYSYMMQLGLSSASIKNLNTRNTLVDKLEHLLLVSQPDVLYTHNPADKHATHVAVFNATIDALRRIPPSSRPKKVYGCEIWRDLDWLEGEDKVALDVSQHPDLAQLLNACFESQILGGKNYSEAVIGRRTANATFHQSHSVDLVTRICYAIDLTPLVEDDTIKVDHFLKAKIERFSNAVLGQLTE